MTPIADYLRLPFAGLAFASVVSLIPGVFLFRMAGGMVELATLEHQSTSRTRYPSSRRWGNGRSDHPGDGLRLNRSENVHRTFRRASPIRQAITAPSAATELFAKWTIGQRNDNVSNSIKAIRTMQGTPQPLCFACLLLLSDCAISAENAELNSGHRVRNIVLVHGAWADGSGWKGVYDILVQDEEAAAHAP